MVGPSHMNVHPLHPAWFLQGCGRQVAPGTTKRGKPFDTCCRGCVMGFGHDMTCGHLALVLGPANATEANVAGWEIHPLKVSMGKSSMNMGFFIAMFHY